MEEGEILLNGSLPDRAPVTQATREAAAVKAALKRAGWEKGDVMPVLCFASDTFAGAQQMVGTAVVVNASEVTAWMQSRPKVLSDSDVERLAQLMETCV